MTDDKIKAMQTEYAKGGKFKEFIDKATTNYGTSVSDECQKATCYEYYLSIQPNGCNAK